ncbi:hypothetical protein EG878_14585 [Enterococcus faecalis]|nr:hypothetical protein EG878_14585 [Enterococcus faecalis]
MGLGEAIKIASSEVVFATLFILLGAAMLRWIVVFIKQSQTETIERENYIFEMHKQREADLKQVIAEQKKESEQREERLMKQIDFQQDQQRQIVMTLGSIQHSLEKLETKIDNDLHDIWRVLDDPDRIKRRG